MKSFKWRVESSHFDNMVLISSSNIQFEHSFLFPGRKALGGIEKLFILGSIQRIKSWMLPVTVFNLKSKAVKNLRRISI